MRFFVAGTYEFTLRVSDRAIFDWEGNELEGLAMESQRTIIISGRIEPERRKEVLVHELTHCWSFFVPRPRDEEERCRLNGAIMRQLDDDLEREGGEDSLQTVTPTKIEMGSPRIGISHGQEVEDEHFGSPDRRCCGGCQADVMCGSIENSDPVFISSTKEHQIQRWMRCEACDALTIWGEICTPDGRPTGKLVQIPAPKVLYGVPSRDWVRGEKLKLKPVVSCEV